MSKNNIKKRVLLIARKDAFNIENITEFVKRNFNATIIVESRNIDLPKK